MMRVLKGFIIYFPQFVDTFLLSITRYLEVVGTKES